MEKKKNLLTYFLLLLMATFVINGNASIAQNIPNTPNKIEQIKEKKITINITNRPLREILTAINEQTGIMYGISGVELNEKELFSLNANSMSLKDALDLLFLNSKYDYNINENRIILMLRKTEKKTASQAKMVTGRLLDGNNKPLIGATVIIEGTTLGAITDKDGNFAIKSTLGKGVLLCSFIGYNSVKVNFVADTPTFVKMSVNYMKIDEVQIVAYGTQKKRLLTSSISSINAEDLKELPTHSLENLLQGHMAGVEINNISGSPGGGGSIVAIRGYNSLMIDGEGHDRKYGSPLYVIDGVPMQAFTSPITGANTLSDIDPSMIESIEVLKDAASAAIYGSRAGNGVILITTKKGKIGKPKFSANASYSASWLPNTPLMSGGHKYERGYHINGLMNSITPYFDTKEKVWKLPSSYEEAFNNKTNKGPMFDYFWGDGSGNDSHLLQDSLNSFYNNSSDWWKSNYRVANVYNANMQASGGNENIQYMVGAGYYSEDGIVINSGFQRLNLISNLSINIAKNLKLDYQQSLSYSDRSRGGGNSGFAGAKIEGISSDPMWTSSLMPNSGPVLDYLVSKLNGAIEKNNSYSARSSLRLNYEILPRLNFVVSGSFDFNQQNQNTFVPSTLDQYTNMSTSSGIIGRNMGLINENLLTYQFTIAKNHNFGLLAGLSFETKQINKINGSGTNGPSDLIHYVDSWGDANGLIAYGSSYRPATTYGSDFEEERMMSYFGRFSYNYKEKYVVEATLRRDASSVFGENVRWATFPSLSAGWIFTEEPFMKNMDWLSFGKVRVSWGTSGQKFTQNYLTHGLISPTMLTFHGKPAMEPDLRGGVINKNLTWEETDQFDLGFDLSLLNHRIKITADYYYRYTSGQLNKIDLPGGGDTYFHQFQWINAMDVSNSGIEFDIVADVLVNTAVKWRTKFNVSRNWNKFEGSYNNRDHKSAIIGKPLYQMRVFKTNGYYNSIDEVPLFYDANQNPQPMYTSILKGIFFDGARRIQDLNGDGKISTEDYYYAGSPLPLAHGGWSNEIRWKDFDLNLMFTYSLGRKALKVYDDLHISPNEEGGPILNDINKIKPWSKGSNNSSYPNLIKYANLLYQYSGNYDSDIENVSYVRMKQITLGYNLNKEKLKKIGLTNARLFLTVENLFLISNYSGLDPELIDVTTGTDQLNSYPLPRKFTVGLTINF